MKKIILLSTLCMLAPIAILVCIKYIQRSDRTPTAITDGIRATKPTTPSGQSVDDRGDATVIKASDGIPSRTRVQETTTKGSRNPTPSSADDERFMPNHGTGLKAIADYDLKPEDLAGFDGPEVLKAVVLDLDARLSLRNEAMNGLRRSGYKDFIPLALHIAKSALFEDDYRAYAVQHLAIQCQAQCGEFRDENWYFFTFQPFLKPDQPICVQREAAYSLLEQDATRTRAMAWIEEKIRQGGRKSFGDIYLRAVKEFSVKPRDDIIALIQEDQHTS